MTDGHGVGASDPSPPIEVAATPDTRGVAELIVGFVIALIAMLFFAVLADRIYDRDPVPSRVVLLDPVCGMTVAKARARSLAEHDGVVFAFCSMGCRTSFMREPAAYVPSSVPSTD